MGIGNWAQSQSPNPHLNYQLLFMYIFKIKIIYKLLINLVFLEILENFFFVYKENNNFYFK